MDRLTFSVGVGAIVATMAVGQCATSARFDDVNRRIDDLRADTTGRLDSLQSEMREFRAEIRAEIRELRALVIEAIRKPGEE